jgi:hypothetical protein
METTSRQSSDTAASGEVTVIEGTTTVDLSNPQLGDLRADWDKVEPALLELLQRAPHHTWRPIDVYAAVYSGDALYMCTRDGFVILETSTCPYTKEKALFIWVAYAYNRNQDLVGLHLRFFEGIAKKLGCTSIKTSTPIDELEPHLINNGFELSTRTFVRPLNGKQA